MLIKTYSLRPHCVSCWTIYISHMLFDDDDDDTALGRPPGSIRLLPSFVKISRLVEMRVRAHSPSLRHVDTERGDILS